MSPVASEFEKKLDIQEGELKLNNKISIQTSSCRFISQFSVAGCAFTHSVFCSFVEERGTPHKP